jgi:hypothetical protein
VGNEVGNEAWNEVGNEVGNEVRNEVRNEVGNRKIFKKYYSFSWYGNFSDYGWVSFHDFFDRLKLFNDSTARLGFRKLRDTVLAAGIYDMIQLKRFCIVISRPTEVHKGQRRLHNVKGHAVKFRDGYGVYRLHGVRLDKKLFDKFTSGKMTALEIITHPNQDQKRAMAMVYGNEKMVTELKAKEVAREIDNQGHTMRILAIAQKEDVPLVFYEAFCPSKVEKVYLRIPTAFALQSDTKMMTPSQAKVWTYPIMWEEYEETGVLPQFEMET